MRRTVAIAQPLPQSPGVLEMFREDPGRWLPSARANGPGAWLCEVGPTAGGLWGGAQNDTSATPDRQPWVRPVRCEVGEVWRDGDAIWRSVVWTPVSSENESVEATRLLPTLDAHLHLVGPPERRSLVLTGEIGLPLGWIGGALDVALLHRVGDSTVSAFLQLIAGRLIPVMAPPAPGADHT